MNDKILNEILVLLRSHYHIINIETVDDDRAYAIAKEVAELKNIPFFEWSVHKGLMKMGDAFLDTQDILKVLTYISGTIDQGVYLLRGFKPFLENTEVQSHLISLVDRLNNDESALFFTGKGAHLEDPLKSHIASLTLPLPTENELLKLLKQIYQDLSQKIKSKSIFQKRIWKY